MKEIIIAIIGSLAAIFGFITFLIGRRDKKKAEKEAKAAKEDYQNKAISDLTESFNSFKDKFSAKIDDLQVTCQRADLDRLICNHPEKVSDIMVSAHKYFVERSGDSWMKQVFIDYLDANMLPHPEYLDKVE